MDRETDLSMFITRKRRIGYNLNKVRLRLRWVHRCYLRRPRIAIMLIPDEILIQSYYLLQLKIRLLGFKSEYLVVLFIRPAQVWWQLLVARDARVVWN